MGFFVVAGVVVLFVCGSERVAARARRLRIERDRATAEYPMTANDPAKRIII